MKDLVDFLDGLEFDPFEKPLFYKRKGSLRFELTKEETESCVILMLQSIGKFKDIFSKYVLNKNNKVYVCFNAELFGDGFFCLRNDFRSLTQSGLNVTNFCVWKNPFERNDEFFSKGMYLNFATECDYDLMDVYIWLAMSRQSNVTPSSNFYVYFFIPSMSMVIWPYDWRGADVYSSRKDVMQDLFDLKREFLLEYDIDEMNGMYLKNNVS